MKTKITIIVLAIICVISIVLNIAYAFPNMTGQVYVASAGNSYHRAGCKQIIHSKPTTMPLHYAKMQNTPCEVCKP